jgi:hypothetical protein
VRSGTSRLGNAPHLKSMKKDITTAELKKLARKHNGLLRPETVVNAARPVSSPLHSRFEWDDSVAGENYRMWQARCLINVAVETMAETGESFDVFVSLKSDRRKGGYRIVTDVMSDAQMRQQMLKDALEELEIFRDKYQRLKQLSGVFESISRLRVPKSRQARSGRELRVTA